MEEDDLMMLDFDDPALKGLSTEEKKLLLDFRSYTMSQNWNNALSGGRYDLGNPLTTSNDAPDKSRMRFLGVSGGIFLKMLFWKIYGFSKITFTSINVLKKTFSRSWSRYRLIHTLHCIFADGK